MTPEKYEKVAHLYHAALDLPRERRSPFLADACAADESLRLEVESLLAANEAAGDFILTSAMSVAARAIAHEEDGGMLTGRVGAYDIVSLIGQGGMGEVYQAHDTRLGRKVALKLLRPALTGNSDAVRRFEQEARAASSLNHPNIVTIYEIGDMDGRRFLAMELVEGHSLSARVDRPVGLEAVARMGAQLARALSVAHVAGIVHRDIKPENIMVRADGYVKLLDFGLARLVPQPAATLLPEDAATRVRTILGTPRICRPSRRAAKPLRAPATCSRSAWCSSSSHRAVTHSSRQRALRAVSHRMPRRFLHHESRTCRRSSDSCAGCSRRTKRRGRAPATLRRS